MNRDRADQLFDHVVITRFTAVFDPTHDPLPRDWVEYRLGFFYDALCASMRAQEGAADFTWLVFFDDRIDADLRAEIDEQAQGLFVPVWTHAAFREEVRRATAEHLSGRPYLLTTRIDSDDAVAKDYLATIQDQFDGRVDITYNFPRGLQLVRTGEVYRYDEPAGPFQTFVEKVAPGIRPQTVFAEPRHHRARSKGALREVQTRPMWLQVIHGTNLANAVRGVMTSPVDLNERFVLDLPYRQEIPRAELFRGAVTSRGRRLVYWGTHPYYIFESVDARIGRLRGTYTLPQVRGSEGPPLTSFIWPRTQKIRDITRPLRHKSTDPQ